MSSPIELLIKSVKLFTSNIGYFFKYWLVQTGLTVLVLITLAIPIGVGGFIAALSGNLEQVSAAPLWLLVLFVPLIVLISSWLSAGMYLQVKSVIDGTRIAIKDLLKQAWGLVGKYIFTILLAGIIVLLGLLALVIPGVILLVWFSFVGGVLFYENLGGLAALKRSKAIVKGKFLKVMWYMAFPSLILMLIQFGIGIIVGMFSNISPGLANTVQTLLSILLIPSGLVIAIYSLLTYKTFVSAK